MRVTQTICGAGAVFVLAVWSLYSQSPAKPKPRNPTATSAQSAARTADSSTAGSLPQLIDITASTGIHFEHLSSPEQRYIVESMSAGVSLIDYDGDGWPDIYFTNAQSVEMALAGKKARSALFHNNHDGTFTDVTEKGASAIPAGVWAHPWATIITMAGLICLSPVSAAWCFIATMVTAPSRTSPGKPVCRGIRAGLLVARSAIMTVMALRTSSFHTTWPSASTIYPPSAPARPASTTASTLNAVRGSQRLAGQS